MSTFGYDALGRITDIGHAYDGTPVMTLGYVYDAVGNVTDRTDDQGTAGFTYDDLDRLTAADYVGADDYSYQYDAVGNITEVVSPSGTTTHGYDDADRIDDAGYTWDDNGALLTDGTRTFTYDDLGRLTGVSGGGHTAAYVLDGDGNRVSQTVDSITTAFDLDLRGMPTVLVAGGDAYLPGMPSLGSSDGTDWVSALTDAQGSVLRNIDDAGAMTALTRYDPYGSPRPSTTLPDGIGFTGEWADPTGLVNLRARAYDPSLGAFLSRDAFGGRSTMPLTGNRHAYAVGNPMRFTDPSGHFISALGGLDALLALLAASAQAPQQLTLGPEDIDRMSEADLLRYFSARQAACEGKLANWPGCQDFGYAYCRIGRLDPGTCREYASLKDWDDLDGPFGTFVAAPLAAGITFLGIEFIVPAVTASRDRILSAQQAGQGVVGFATKADARAFAASLQLPQSQAEAVASAISRATTATRIDIIKQGESVIVNLSRYGANGYQVVTSAIGPRGTDVVVQLAYDAAGKLVHIDQKFSPRP